MERFVDLLAASLQLEKHYNSLSCQEGFCLLPSHCPFPLSCQTLR